jgi:FAD:protein FMN transferase
MQRLEFRAMGCQMAAVVDSDDDQAILALNAVPAWFEEWETSLSRFRPDSELNRLNQADGRPFHASDTLWQVLETAMAAARLSAGLVTPAVLEALEAAGYDKSFELLAADERNVHRPQEASLISDWQTIERDVARHIVLLPGGMRLDFGGVAKGWAADQAVRRLAPYGPALVDAGGDIAVNGTMSSGERWPIGIADPMAPERDLDLLMLGAGAVATSGRDYRRWTHDGQPQHHILDPRTGRPATTDVVSATVVAPSAREAEVAAKVAFILGSQTGLSWIEARPHLAALLVLEDGPVVHSRLMEDYLWGKPMLASF